MKNEKTNGQKSQKEDVENKKMEIEITRYKRLVETFNHPRALAKLIVVVSVIIILVFLGISIIALVVKSYYPYKVVNSNEYGATIIGNEDNEVIYWLFNTADLWANSGIHVKKGDVISVRAAGAFHSSIHHLVKDANTNSNLSNWLTPIGGPNSKNNPRGKARARFRISPTHEINTLLMQVIPENVELKDKDGNWIAEYDCYLDGKKREVFNNNNTIDYNKSVYPDIYVIGAERDIVTIRNDGVLHFAVNDIALTRYIIKQMNRMVKIDTKEHKDISKMEIGWFPFPDFSNYSYFKTDSACYKKIHDDLIDFDKENCLCADDSLDNGENMEECNKKYDALLNKIDSIYNIKYDYKFKLSQKDSFFFQDKYTELDYYLIRNFVDAWFVDNIGSYLIVIERKKQ